MAKVLVRTPVFPSDFRALFQTLARCAVAGSFGIAAGCASSSSQGDADASTAESWTPLVCDEDGNWPLEDTSIAAPLDYLAQYVAYVDTSVEGEPSRSTYESLVVHGSACAGASDGAACAAALQQKIDENPCTENPCADFLIATEGDTVTRIEERAALNALLGTIDTETEAAIAALLGGGALFCWNEGISGSVDPSGTHVRASGDGYVVETLAGCYDERWAARTLVDASGRLTVLSKLLVCEGRRPAGLAQAAPCNARNEVGAHFARAAHFEAASVVAFEQLARDLQRLGAPRELIELALRSALDEVGHARTMQALAERFGGELITPFITTPSGRDALAIALENAVEGCVNETYGALLACYQAHAARDPHVRAAMTQIAEDETRHAQLSWQIAAWLEPRLSEAERAAVSLARRAAYAQLSRTLAPRLSADALHVVGLPDEAVSAGLLTQLGAALSLRA